MNSNWNDKIKYALLSFQEKHARVARPEVFTFEGLGNIHTFNQNNCFSIT